MYMIIFTIHIIIHLNLGFKFLFYLNGNCFNFKKKTKKKNKDFIDFQLRQIHLCETVGKCISIATMGTGRNYKSYSITQCLSHTCNFRTFLIALISLPMFYMKLDLSAGMSFQIQLKDTLGLPGMLDNYPRSYQTKLEVLSQKEFAVIQKNIRQYMQS